MKSPLEIVANELFDVYEKKDAPLINIVAALEVARGTRNAAGLPSSVLELSRETHEFFERKNVSELERVWVIDFALHKVFFTLFAKKQRDAEQAAVTAALQDVLSEAMLGPAASVEFPLNAG